MKFLKWLSFFRKPKRESPAGASEAVEEAPEGGVGTAPFREEDLRALQEELGRHPVLRPPQFLVGMALDVGLQRDHNEDALYAHTTVIAAQEHDLRVGLFIVADGMGGHLHGERASEVAVRAMAQYIWEQLLLPLSQVEHGIPERPLMDIVEDGVLRANRAVLEYASGGGSTLTAALVLGQQLTIAHVGDSRAYLISPTGQAQLLTRDHSLVKRLEELQQLTPEEAAHHPQRNVLYRALGQTEPLQPDTRSLRLPPAGHLLLCSDGLWGVVPEEEIISLVQSIPDPGEACRAMVRAAHREGAPDNISVILVRLG